MECTNIYKLFCRRYIVVECIPYTNKQTIKVQVSPRDLGYSKFKSWGKQVVRQQLIQTEIVQIIKQNIFLDTQVHIVIAGDKYFDQNLSKCLFKHIQSNLSPPWWHRLSYCGNFPLICSKRGRSTFIIEISQNCPIHMTKVFVLLLQNPL